MKMKQSRYICKNCNESDRYLCFNCSILHPKIKAFKDHTVEPLSSSGNRGSFAPSNHFDADAIRKLSKEFLFNCVKYISKYVEYVYDIVSNKESVDSTVYYQTVALAVLAVFMGYSLLKALFGPQAIIVVLILLYGYHYIETQVSKEMKDILNKSPSSAVKSPVTTADGSKGLYKISQRKGFERTRDLGGLPTFSEGGTLPSSSIQISEDKEEFKNEFWHDMECKPAKFRPRGRAYKLNRTVGTNEQS